MFKEKEDVIRKAMVIFDGFVMAGSFVAAYLLRQHFHIFYKLDLVPHTKVVTQMVTPLSNYLVVLFIVIPIWCAILAANGMYSSMRTRKINEIIYIILKSAFFTVLFFGAFTFLFKLKFVSRIFFGLFILTGFFLILAEKISIFAIMHYVRKQGYNFRRLLVVGTGERALKFIKMTNNHPEWGLKITGVIDDEPGRQGKLVSDKSTIGALGNLQNILHDNPIDEVVFMVPRSRLQSIENSLYICETEGVKATIAVDLFELKIAKSRQTDIEGIPLITFETTFAHEWQLFIKRGLDIIVSVFFLVILSPLFLAVSILIKLTSPGPVLFLQKRIGLHGRKFILYKFRTMYENAHLKLSELSGLNEQKGPVFKIKDDPRVTSLGKFLRKFSIDEFPQIINILLGHMSLVGPRPPLAKEVALYKPWQRRRLSMRPGLTCFWQISGRNEVTFEQWMELDLKYLDNWSLFLDFIILLKTIPAVLFGKGAY